MSKLDLTITVEMGHLAHNTRLVHLVPAVLYHVCPMTTRAQKLPTPFASASKYLGQQKKNIGSHRHHATKMVIFHSLSIIFNKKQTTSLVRKNYENQHCSIYGPLFK
jgi:hypothetical protein